MNYALPFVILLLVLLIYIFLGQSKAKKMYSISNKKNLTLKDLSAGDTCIVKTKKGAFFRGIVLDNEPNSRLISFNTFERHYPFREITVDYDYFDIKDVEVV